MPRTSPNIVAKQAPTGTQTIRLDTIPLETRLLALSHIVRTLTPDEAIIILDLCIDPQDASARIAA